MLNTLKEDFICDDKSLNYPFKENENYTIPDLLNNLDEYYCVYIAI